MIDFYDRVNTAIKEACGQETWPGYYLIRGDEFKNLFLSIKSHDIGKTLEVGCGNGFFSYLVSSVSSTVIATDLYCKDPKSHTVGMDNARQLISKIGGKNISLCACSGESLPFKDDVFDLVFSSYTLQYIKDRQFVLNELKRVVKKDGEIVLVLPNFTERVYSFFQYYVYFMVKAIKMVFKKIYGKKISRDNNAKNHSFDIKKFKEDYKYFPFPGPHGAYKNSFIEMISHMPHRWNAEFKRAGLKLNSSFTTVFVPYPLILTISYRLACNMLFLSKKITQFLGTKPFIKYFGYNYCVVLKK
ncbi:MAG: methyltransferase domain-containing protein [Candidatus Omnitrophota bacterium]|jgi:ubiquinone/menaquinone biosynthesis C-methylase UbiE